MENASKALIIAGAILLSILIIGLGMFIYQQAAGAMEGVGLDSQQVDSYNAAFASYEGTQSGASVRNLCQNIRSHNNTNVDDPTLQIGIIYGSNGVGKEDDGDLDTAITTDNVNAVMNQIRTGKRYTVSFNYGTSGRIIGVEVTDYSASSSST